MFQLRVINNEAYKCHLLSGFVHCVRGWWTNLSCVLHQGIDKDITSRGQVLASTLKTWISISTTTTRGISHLIHFDSLNTGPDFLHCMSLSLASCREFTRNEWDLPKVTDTESGSTVIVEGWTTLAVAVQQWLPFALVPDLGGGVLSFWNSAASAVPLVS